jgi:hypothetical protein
MRVLTLGGVQLAAGTVLNLLPGDCLFDEAMRFLVHDPIAVVRDVRGEQWALVQGFEQLAVTGGAVSRLLLVRASALAHAMTPPQPTAPQPRPEPVGSEFSVPQGGPRR